MVEILVSIVIVSVGLLGLAGLQARAMNSEFESYQRGQAIQLANDMVDRIRLNRANAGTFQNVTTNTTAGTPYLGGVTTDTALFSITCSPAPTSSALLDLCDWQSSLRGAGEVKSGVSVGAMVGARGCITYDPATVLTDPVSGVVLPDTGWYTVIISWQGTSNTLAPTLACANGLYGDERARRVVSVRFRLAKLN